MSPKDPAAELLDMKQELEEAKQEQDQAKGSFRQVMSDIRTRFKCKDLDEAEALLKKQQAQEIRARKKYEKLLNDYREKWAEALDDEDD